VHYVINQVFTEDERNTFIADQLKKEPVNRYFFSRLMRWDEKGAYSRACHDMILAQPGLFVEIVDQSGLQLIRKVVSPKETVDLLIGNSDSLNFDDAIDEELVLNLLESPKLVERLVGALERSGNSAGLVMVAKALGAIQEKNDPDIEGWQSNIATLKSDIRGLLTLQSSAAASEKEELQGKIQKKRSELSALEKNKPKERRTAHVKGLAREYQDGLKESIKGLCGSEKFLVFQEDILNVLDMDAEELLKREVEEYIAIHPEVLTRWYSRYGDQKRYGKLVFQEILGKEEFTRLFMSRIRALAFWSGRYGRGIDITRLPEDLIRQVEDANPLVRLLGRPHLEKDFYESALDVIRQYQLYPLYAERLERIAREEMRAYGPRLETEAFRPNAGFAALARAIFLLESSGLALKNKEAILRLPPGQQEELITMLCFISAHHLEEPAGVSITEENYSQVREDALSGILTFSKKLFDMENAEIAMAEPISMDAINALSVYYNKSCRENPSMKRAFHQILTPILGGHYANWRAWGSEEAPADASAAGQRLGHLQEEGLLPERMSLEQYRAWLEDEHSDFSETFSCQFSDIQAGIRDIFSLAVVDGHIEEATMNSDGFVLARNYNELIQPIKDLAEKQKEYKRRIQISKKDKTRGLTEEEREEYKHIQISIKEFKDEHEGDIRRIEALRYLDKIKKISIEELESQSISIDQKDITFADAFKVLEGAFSDKPDFLSDIGRARELLIEGNRQIFGGGRVSRSQLIITDHVDLETHVFIGEKPIESCQHYNGSSLNYGLLSYISDPAIKILQIWDGNGTIIARSILRLMEDEKHDPQLFMERVYSVNNHPKIKEAMVQCAAKKAKSMGVGIYTQDEECRELARGGDASGDNKVVLYSRGSRSPYTYTDAGGGKVPNGIFKVEIYS